MYVLVIHTITDITAKVPFAMMVLQDAIKTKAIPSQMKITQVLPTSGPRSMSLWEAPSVEEVETYTNQLLSDWCINECFPVVEDQAYGLNLQKAVSSTKHGAEMVYTQTANTSKAVYSAVSTGFVQMDEKFHLNEKAKALGSRMAELTVRARSGAEGVGSKALENPHIASASSSLGAAWGAFGKRAYAAGSAVAQRAHDVNTVVVARVQQYGQSGTAGEEVPVWDAAAETTNLDDAISAPLAEDVPAPESASKEPK
mmetsp:Transcript_39062/g.65638  ORF Transcript_39062/g.65638 Transcript_39062/m.65638 type:complete len:256 (-) Transcript_39062:1345-2112(-)|eukprot:CAMPEP_0198201054 /NCGR_PEP_ID=MMETSP1445-20131203/3882_1 /TAXON_ID=36898 /ORGANISM="Pyramimonas sp., Strain CCMP2087" /LENGTH=255 /DNA_ID=CAMNT_0043871243 /DNA_START=224 /DNA_END=991 /DNA_ORIENTATION=-